MAKSTSKKASANKPATAARRPARSGAKATASGPRKSAPPVRASAAKARPAPAPAANKPKAPIARPKPAAASVQSLPKRPVNGKAPAAPTRGASPNPPARVPDVAPPAGGEKPKKVASGLTSRDLEMFRDLLLAKRRELVGDMSAMEREALRSSGGSNLSTLPIHMADMGTDNYEQEFTLGLVEKDRNLLREINAALAKIQNGTYGICEATGKPIGKARLEVQPWARFSIEYARQMEKGRRAV